MALGQPGGGESLYPVVILSMYYKNIADIIKLCVYIHAYVYKFNICGFKYVASLPLLHWDL